jgi:hypothetical protein
LSRGGLGAAKRVVLTEECPGQNFFWRGDDSEALGTGSGATASLAASGEIVSGVAGWAEFSGEETGGASGWVGALGVVGDSPGVSQTSSSTG